MERRANLVKVNWTKGHVTRDQIAEGLYHSTEAVGNHFADKGAAYGAAIHDLGEAETSLLNWVDARTRQVVNRLLAISRHTIIRSLST